MHNSISFFLLSDVFVRKNGRRSADDGESFLQKCDRSGVRFDNPRENTGEIPGQKGKLA